MTVVGGKRILFIRDSLYEIVKDILSQQGYLTPNPGVRKDVQFILSPMNNTTELQPNIVGMSIENAFGMSMELGSNLERDEWNVFFDIYAENEDLGYTLGNDIRDILRGKFASLGRDSTEFLVKDGETGADLFYCDLEDIEIVRRREYDRPYEKFWWTVGASIIDDYYDDLN